MTQPTARERKRVIRPIRLLLIDDNPHDRELVSRALSQHFGSLTVVPVRDAVEFERAMAFGEFDAAIVDYRLNWTTGMQALRRIKRFRPDCPVLMFTASGSEEVAVEAMKEGLDDYVTKTLKHYARLPYALEAALERTHQQRELAEVRLDRNRLSEQVRTGQRRLQFALEAAGLVAWEVSLASDHLQLSSNAAEVFGAQWTTASQAMAAVNPADLDRVRAAYEAALETGGTFTCELRLTHNRDRQEIWLEVRGQPLRGASGSVVAVAGVAVDITDRRLAERERAQLAAVVQSSDDAIITLTPDGFVSSWNRGASVLFGYSNEEMIGQSIEKIIPQAIREEQALVRQRVTRGERLDHYETVRTAKDGREIFVSTRLSPILDRAGRVIGISKILRDITKLKKAEEELRLSDQRKDAFLAILAHELRNPLAPIRYATRLLEPGVPAQMASDARQMIERQLAHMARLLDDLLDVSRFTRGKLQIQRAQLDLRDVIATATASVQSLIDAAHQELNVDLPPEPLQVSGDPVRLAQILGNLLHNATKYTPTGGHISLVASRVAEEIIVSVKDDGIGIPPEMLQTVFELFVQLDPAGSRAAGGLGIGLSLARDLILLHGGQIEARSAGRGLGSEFIVRLPRAGEKPALTEPVAAPEKVTALGASGVRVLIVDDNADAATALSYVLTVAGYETKIAHDGTRAIALAEETRPEIVLLDIGLPGLSGYEVARRLRSLPSGQALHLIAVTGWGREDDRTKSLEAGFDEHLTKPIDPELLLQRIVRASRSAA